MSALQFYDSLKAPGIEGIVWLHRLAALAVRGERFGTGGVLTGTGEPFVVWCSAVAVAEFV